MVTNIANDGFDYEWNEDKSYTLNLAEFLEKHTPNKLAEHFLEAKTLRWEGKSYREVLGTSAILEQLIFYSYNQLGKSLWKRLVSNAMIWDKLDPNFTIRFINTRFRHNEIDMDADLVMQTLAPMIPAKDVYSKEHTDTMYHSKEMILPYFKALNDKITKRKAETIFEDFNKDGLTILGIPAQNWLIDNNKHIQKIIEEMGLIEDFPPKTVRDMFLF
jgi:hypothetical protein